MKIYNKKTFALGLLFLILGIALLAVSISKGFEIQNSALMVLCAMIGFSYITRSLSRENSRQDKIDDLDERNRLIALKSRSKSFTLTQAISGILTMLFLAAGAALDEEQMIAVGVGLCLCFTISLCAELFTKLYYEKHD